MAARQYKLVIQVMGMPAEIGRYPTQKAAMVEFARQTDKGVSPGDLAVIEVKS